MNRKIDGRKKLTPFVLKKESLFVMLKTAFKHERQISTERKLPDNDIIGTILTLFNCLCQFWFSCHLRMAVFATSSPIG